MSETQTRQEHYNECKEKGLPLPELVKPGPNIASQDVNVNDIRDVFADDTYGPWRRAED